jgi:hypothetical protein
MTVSSGNLDELVELSGSITDFYAVQLETAATSGPVGEPSPTLTTVTVEASGTSVDAIGAVRLRQRTGCRSGCARFSAKHQRNTVVSLTDGTSIVFTGAPSLHTENFF